MMKRNIIIVSFALLAYSMATAQPQRYDSHQQEYIYQTDDHKIEESIASVCHDSLSHAIVSKAIGLYLDDTDNMVMNWNGIRTELPKAKKEADNLKKLIQNMNKRIIELTNSDEDDIEVEHRWTNQQLDSLRKELKDSLSLKQKKQKEINESNLYVTHYNQWVHAQNKYMAKHQPNIEKGLDDLLEEANKLMASKYSKTKNEALAKELRQRFKKNQQAATIATNLDNESQACEDFNRICGLLKKYIELQDVVFLTNEMSKFEKNYRDSYKTFNEAFKKLESELEKKKLTVEKIDRILKETIDNE